MLAFAYSGSLPIFVIYLYYCRPYLLANKSDLDENDEMMMTVKYSHCIHKI